MKRKTVAQVAVEVLLEYAAPGVIYGDAGLLDEIAARSDMKVGKGPYCVADHPLLRWKRVLDRLESSPLFEKRIIDGKRAFYLRERKNDPERTHP